MAANQSTAYRPTSAGYVTLARVCGVATSGAAGVAVALGIWPDAKAAGGLSIFIPVVVASVVVVGLTSAWHVLFGYAAHSRKIHERSLAFGFGVGLFFVGAGCSGWFLAALIGGSTALQNYQSDFIESLKASSETIANNTSIEAALISQVRTSASDLGGAATAERDDGVVSKKPGKGSAYNTIQGSSNSLISFAINVEKLQKEKLELIKNANEDIFKAEEYAAKHDIKMFQEKINKASALLSQSAKIDILSSWNGISTILALNPKARELVERASSEISFVVRDIKNKKLSVALPTYRPVDTKTAVWLNPPPLSWIAAILIEALPLVFLGLLLTVWRDPDTEKREGTDFPIDSEQHENAKSGQFSHRRSPGNLASVN